MLNLELFTKLLARRRAIMIMMAAAFGLLVLVSGAGHAFDWRMRELREALRSHSASGDLVIIEMDAKSVQAIAKWPWPRSNHAAAVDRLASAGARSIAFDVDFSSLSNPAQDSSFASALERAGGGVILPTMRQQETADSVSHLDSAPAKPFLDHSFLGAVTVVPDPDGYVREMPLGIETFGTPHPSIASLLAETKAVTGRYFEIDYAIDPSTIPRHSFVDLIKGRVPTDQIRGKRILIGATSIEMGDRYVVPNYGVIPGVVIQALGVETLMEGRVPLQLGPLPALILALGLVVACATRMRRRLRSIVFALGSALILALPIVTEQFFAISLKIAPAAAALAAATAVAGATYLAERFRARALTDPATGLPNLLALEEAAQAAADPLVVVGHMDRFSVIASGLGPEATARLVTRVAERLEMANGGRRIYRTDEASLAWIEENEQDDTLEDRLEAIVAVMRSPVECGRLVDVSLSIGMAAESEDAGQLVANASLAATQAARKGLRWQRFSRADSEEADWQLSLLSELDGALTSGQIWNAYQPKLDIKTGRIIGAETLVRWLHPERGPIAPDNFIPIIEEHGRIRDLTLHVLSRALEDAAHWEVGGLPISIAVNISATLLADSDFVNQVRQVLDSATIPASDITLEVTESAAMRAPEEGIPALESWRALGVNISIDDYGTGQSSLGYLQKLPATELKIDKSFIQDLNVNERNAIMVRSTIALAHELGLKVVAEGIEDEACLKTLADMGCDTAQGYFIGRPMSGENLAVFLGGGEREAA